MVPDEPGRTIAFAAVLEEVVDILGDVSYGVIGGVASAAYGRPRWTKDIDVFCRRGRRPCARPLREAGIRRRPDQPNVDLQGVSRRRPDRRHLQGPREVYFDNEMAQRVRPIELDGVEIPVLAPEDIVDEGDGRRRGVAVALVRRLGISPQSTSTGSTC